MNIQETIKTDRVVAGKQKFITLRRKYIDSMGAIEVWRSSWQHQKTLAHPHLLPESN